MTADGDTTTNMVYKLQEWMGHVRNEVPASIVMDYKNFEERNEDDSEVVGRRQNQGI